MNCCQPGGRSDGSSVSDDEGEDGFSGADGAASDGALGDLVESWPASDGVLSTGGVSGDGFSGFAGSRSLNWMLLGSLANRIRLEGGVATSSRILSAGCVSAHALSRFAGFRS